MSADARTVDQFAAALPEAERTALLAAGRRRRYPRHARLFHEGDRSDFVVVILEGRVKIVVTTEEGGESVLSVRGRGALVGELAALDAGPRLASAVALDPLIVQVLTAEEFRVFVVEHSGAALQLVRMLVGRLREADRRRIEFGAYGVAGRVARLLAELAAEQDPNGHGAVEVRLSQQEVAAMIGASRESVARALAALRDRGLVTTGRRTIAVVEPVALRSFVG